MFVLTVDQVASRTRGDRVEGLLPELVTRWADDVLLGPDRTAGDEFQLLTRAATAALGIVLDLTRDGGWSVGLGVGAVDDPLPATTREASGSGFIAARTAVERAKGAVHRFALEGEPDGAGTGAADAEALVDLLLDVRARRSPEGWAVADRTADGTTQAAIAAELGLTPQAVSLPARTAGLRLERRAPPALVRLLARLDDGPSS